MWRGNQCHWMFGGSVSTWLGSQFPERVSMGSPSLFPPSSPPVISRFRPSYSLLSPSPFLSCKRCRLCADQENDFWSVEGKLLREDKILSVVTTDSGFASNVSGPPPAIRETRPTDWLTNQRSSFPFICSPPPLSSCLGAHVACE